MCKLVVILPQARTVEDRLAALEKSQAALEESVQEIVKILRFITCCCPCI